MSKKCISTLIETDEDMYQNEIFAAPELVTLKALDGNLLAAIKILEFQHTNLWTISNSKIDTDEHIAKSIISLANALRLNLFAYYCEIHENMDLSSTNTNERDTPF